MGGEDARSDAQLLRATGAEPEAFATFYRRHAEALLAYLLRRTGHPEVAADLTAETFAAALERCGQFDPARGPARAWLFWMASTRLVDAARRGKVEDRARRRLGMPVRALDDHGYEAIERRLDAARTGVEALVAGLPPDQRDAVLARVVDEREYSEIAAEQQISPAAARQRVARGLHDLRTRARPAEGR